MIFSSNFSKDQVVTKTQIYFIPGIIFFRDQFMFTYLSLTNFKAWRTPIKIDLAPYYPIAWHQFIRQVFYFANASINEADGRVTRSNDSLEFRW